MCKERKVFQTVIYHGFDANPATGVDNTYFLPSTSLPVYFPTNKKIRIVGVNVFWEAGESGGGSASYGVERYRIWYNMVNQSGVAYENPRMSGGSSLPSINPNSFSGQSFKSFILDETMGGADLCFRQLDGFGIKLVGLSVNMKDPINFAADRVGLNVLIDFIEIES
jgi:hypothetical protein